MLLATVEIKAQQPQEAEKIIDQLAALQPDSLTVADLRGDLAATEKQWGSACTNYRQIWAATKSDAAAFKLYQALAVDDVAAAQQFLTEWRGSNPQSEHSYIAEALLSAQHGDKAAAIHPRTPNQTAPMAMPTSSGTSA